MNHPSIQQQITFIYTDNLSQSAKFYEDILGLKLWRDQGSCRIYHVTTTSFIGICQTGPYSKGTVTGQNQDNIILTLVTDEVDSWYHQLQDRGITFESAPQINDRYKIYHCFLRDPNGYLIEIQKFLT